MRRIHQKLAIAGCVVSLVMAGAVADSPEPRQAAESGGRTAIDAGGALAWVGGPRGRGPRQGRGRGSFRGQGRGQGRGPDEQLRADQTVFHFLLAHHEEIERKVTNLDNGVETLTESDNPAVTAKIQEHVAAMHQRINDGNGLRYWDDLFVALFDRHASIAMDVQNTEHGVQVVETSEDPVAVPLIQAHAGVVSLFVKHGFAEARRKHPVPPIE